MARSIILSPEASQRLIEIMKETDQGIAAEARERGITISEVRQDRVRANLDAARDRLLKRRRNDIKYV